MAELRNPSGESPHDDTLVRLPLTETPTGETRTKHVTPQVISTIVEEFYAKCRTDPTLGPIFNTHVHDWPDHLARIRMFWSGAVLRQPGYSGRPLEAHLRLPGLSRDHFSAWLKLWKTTVEEHCMPEDAAAFMTLAGRMANKIMQEGGTIRRGIG